MTFLFDCVSRDDFVYVNADDLSSAIDIFKSHYEYDDNDNFHVFVCIV